ncbi:MAG: GAF domain-containing sensor histidine kinase [Dehalococcoidia bacterium]|nr:GAF domain-containing sensor histidine kinase [Dehalococcoidia bacterium]
MATRSLSTTEQIAALVEVSEALLSTRELTAVLQVIASSVCQLVELERSAIFMYEPATRTIRGIAAHDIDAAEILAIREPLDNSPLANQAIITRAPVLFQDATADRAVPARYIELFHLGALGCAPLIAKGQVVGVIFLDKGGQPFRFTSQQRQLLQAFGNLAAIALENARLHAAAEEGAVLRDRARIAQELHDNVAQIFFSIGLEAKGLLDGATPPSVRRSVARMQKLAAQGGTEIRNAIFALSSPPKPNGLVPSLEHLIREYRASTGNSAELVAQDGLRNVPPEIEEFLYVAAREAVQNARKHAEATLLTLSLGVEEAWLTLSVRDNGRGTAAHMEGASFFGPGFGLRHLRQRLVAHGGSLQISDNREGGVTVSVRIPRS